VKGDGSPAAVAGAGVDFYFVNEHEIMGKPRRRWANKQ
jgi:hypothetical protein